MISCVDDGELPNILLINMIKNILIYNDKHGNKFVNKSIFF